jgi:ABC-type transport system involved in cytochrome c biogenesis permease component
MPLPPIAERELRSLARRPSTYWLRVVGPLALWAPVFGVGLPLSLSVGRGGQVFALLHAALFCGIWILVPLLTADCLSRERREGTLPLLFLAPLRPIHIVLSKALAHGLRATTFLVAALPVLTLPFLMGGVSWREACFSAFINLASLCLALGAGLLASSRHREQRPALLDALVRAGLCLAVLSVAHTLLVVALARPFLPQLSWKEFFNLLPEGAVVFMGNCGPANWGRLLAYWPPPAHTRWLMASGLTTLGAAGALWLMAWLAGRNLGRDWLETPRSRWQSWLHDFFCTPVVWHSFHHRWLRRKLEGNPIAWVELRSWQRRTLDWVWLGACLFIPLVLLGLGHEADLDFLPPELAFAVVPLLGLALSAAASLRRERENGVLELLLITPRNEAQIIGGRLRGLWWRFGPGLLIWCIAFACLWANREDLPREFREFCPPTWASPGAMLVGFAAFPVIGLYFSLARRTFQGALLCTLAWSVLPPLLAVGLALWLDLGYWLGDPFGRDPLPPWACTPLAMAVHGVLLAVFARLLHQRLVQRSFALQQGAV